MVPDQGQRAVRVTRGFRVECDDVGPGFGELRDNVVNRFDHQVDINRGCRVGAYGLTDHGADCQVGNIMVVHDIKMDPVCAGIDDIAHFFAKSGEIGGKQAGGDTDVW